MIRFGFSRHFMMSITAEESSRSKKVDPTSESNDDTSRCRSPTPAASSSKKTSEKSLKNNKIIHLVSQDDISLTNDSWPSAIHPSWLSSPKLIRMSEATSVSTPPSSSITTKPSHTRSGETKSIDSTTCSSQARWRSSSTDVDPLDGYSAASISRHKGDDLRWEAIRVVNSKSSPIGLGHFRLVKRIGYGDIGCVYLAELKGTNTMFAIKVMDKASLVNRNKLLRAQTEREILSLLDHPFLPSLYSHFETEKSCCLVMEYCNGGSLHSLRQKQPNKHFTEKSARFYATEVLLAIEYLHMLGIIYRDLKPENVLVRDDGHIMLSDFDLSLQCSFNPTLIQASSSSINTGDGESILRGCIHPATFLPRMLPKKTKLHRSKLDFGLRARALVELMAEPTDARSTSFVGTHEYLAPEIIRGEGHGSAVDWWTFGVFLFELMYGTTPFKGSENRATLFNIVGQPLLLPEAPPTVSVHAQDLIRGLLVKEPQNRVGCRRGAAEIKQDPFFEGVNWALVRSAAPPYVPEPIEVKQLGDRKRAKHKAKEMAVKNAGSSDRVNFEFF